MSVNGKISRRDLFKKFIPEKFFDNDEQFQDGSGEEVYEGSRREFCQLLGCVGLGTILQEKRTADMERLDERSLIERLVPGDETSSDSKTPDHAQPMSHWQTIRDTLLVNFAAFAIHQFLKKHTSLKFGHALKKEDLLQFLEEDPAGFFLFLGGICPLIEEVLYRLFPSKFLIDKNDGRMRWDIGTMTSFLNTLHHNLDRDADGNRIFTKSIPLYQFITSQFGWFLMRERGFSHSLLSHSFNNITVGVLFSISVLLNRTDDSLK